MIKVDEYLIKIKDLDFSYGGRAIYKNLSMDIPRGKITAILGPSGTGKTTLLRLIGAQLYPERGEVLFDGINVHRLKRAELYELRKRMSMLFQSGHILRRESMGKLSHMLSIAGILFLLYLELKIQTH